MRFEHAPGPLLGAAWVFALATACAPDAPSAAQPTSDAPPNIVLYLVDTLRADSVSPYAKSVVETPVLERLAAKGTLFENAYAQSSWTRASIASLLTST